MFGTGLTEVRSSLVFDSCWQYLDLHSHLIFSCFSYFIFSRECSAALEFSHVRLLSIHVVMEPQKFHCFGKIRFES